MKSIIEKIIQGRNPRFTFDESVDTRLLFGLSANKAWYLVRGLKWFFKGKVPHWLLLGKNVRFFNARNIHLGRWVKLEDQVYLSAMGKGSITIGNNSGIGAFSRLIISTSFNQLGEHIHIGDNVGIGEYAYLGGAGGLEIGEGCIVGQYFSCHPENHVFDDPDIPIRFQGTTRKGIKVGRNCWIGSKVTILDGVTVGDNCVIAAGAVVTRDMPDNAVIGGVPARVIKSRINGNDPIPVTLQQELVHQQ